MPTLDNNIYITEHCTFVVTCHNNTGIIVNALWIVIVIPCSVDIHCNGTFYRHIGCTHQSVKRFFTLSTANTDS